MSADLSGLDLGELSSTATALRWLAAMAGKHRILGPDVTARLDELAPEVQAELDRRRVVLDAERRQERLAGRWGPS